MFKRQAREHEFGKQRQEHHQRVNSAGGRAQEKERALRSGIEWADDAVRRLDEDREKAKPEFHRRKASWKRTVEADEKPGEIVEQTRTADIYRSSGWLAIGIELIIATLTLLGVMTFGLPFAVTLLLAIVLATVVTIFIAYVLHGSLYYLFNRPDDPLEGLRRLKLLVMLPCFVLVLLSIITYVAVQRLDAQTLYALQTWLSFSKLTVMLGFMGLGTALLVAADILSWSRWRDVNYTLIEDMRQKISSQRREWQEELDEIQQKPEATHNTVPLPVANLAQTTQQPPAPVNGSSSNAPHTVLKVSSILLLAALTLGLSACAPPQPQVKKTPVHERIAFDVVVDASGIKNSEALQIAGLHIFEHAAKIIEQQRVTNFSVHWFGQNGWTTEQKLNLTMPSYMKIEVLQQAASEISTLRPDIEEVQKQLNEQALKIAEEQFQTEYRGEIIRSLSPLTIEMLVPAQSTESPCTDINGMLVRFTQPTQDVQRILLIASDGRQNCNGEYLIEKISARPNIAVVVMLIPGTASDGHQDYELRRSRFTDAFPQCVVAPYYREDIENLIADAIKKSSDHSAAAKNLPR